MSKYFKIAMFFTSFLPLWISIIFIDILSIAKKNTNLYTEFISLICISIAIIFSAFVIYGSMNKIKQTDYSPYKIYTAAQEKGITSEFLISYILPLFAFDFTRWDSVIEFLIYFSILSFLCVRNNNVYANLIFELKNYKFYSCELLWTPEQQLKPIQVILISNINLCANKGNTIKVAILNKPFYLVKDLEE